jgi:plastocyanin
MFIFYIFRATRRSMGALLAVVSAASLVACGGSSSTAPASSGTPVTAATVNATPSLQFTPNTVTIVVGGTVTMDFGAVAHDVFFDNDPAGAPASITTPTSNTSATLTFNQAGTFVYNCHIHPGMHGTVVVK